MNDESNQIFANIYRKRHLEFTKRFFELREHNLFIVRPHHRLIADAMDRVIRGETTRLIINIPPGYTKTEMVVVSFIAMGLAVNPAARFIQTSYSDKLINDNSIKIKDTIMLPEYQDLYPMSFKKDTNAKNIWRISEHGGGLLSSPILGQITGFRAGRMIDGFSGALIIDDPIKPDDGYSKAKRERINTVIENTVKSRIALPSTPIILIMQRVHENDCTGFLLKGGTGDHWEHLCIPVEIEDNREYPPEYTHGIEIKHGLPSGMLWEMKHSKQDVGTMKLINPYTFSSQYNQRPTPIGGTLFKREWFRYYDKLPPIKQIKIFADTAMKTKEANDFSVFLAAGLGADGNLYILDIARGKFEAPELLRVGKAFWDRFKGGNPSVRSINIEDKASGTGLIQQLQRTLKTRVVAIQRDTDKISRAMGCIPDFASGRVWLPANAEWVANYVLEFELFNEMMSHDHDDQVDPTLDAVSDMLMAGNIYSNL